MDYLAELNPSQARAANWNDGPLLVLAGPGSGKTKTLTARVARLIASSEGESFRILCLTFTRKAAAEMRERLLALVPDARDRVWLTTFHSFATDILRQHGSHFGFSPDFEIIEESERVSLVKSLIAARSDELTRLLSAEKALSSLDLLFRNLTEDDKVTHLLKDPEMGAQLQILFSAYKDRLKQQNALDYGAILYFCEELLRVRPRVAKQLKTVYRYLCVDEFQDTNVAQFRLLQSLAPDRDSNVFIVGDDDQVIYQWNGASPARIKELERYYDLTTIQLPENYRCPPEVVELANALITHNGDRAAGKQPLQAMKELPNTDSVQLAGLDDESDESTWVAEQIAKRLEAGTAPSEVVVLARTTRLLEAVQRALFELGIPAHVQKRKSQFESAPLRLVVAALKLAAVRSDEDIAAIVTKALSDCIDDDVGVDELASFAAQENGDQLLALGLMASQNSAIPKDVREAVASLVAGNYADFVKNTLAFYDFSEEQGLSDAGNEQFADYPSERDVWSGIVRELGGESDAYGMPLGQFLQELALANKTPEAPSTSVRCLTIHASKGMEFKNVFLVGMAEDQLPSFQSKKVGPDSREMQEERRSCFVAITRTIETLTLSYAKRYNGWRKEPSRFLYEMGLLPNQDST
jgi:DNA helicase-2/ATP-dependent DNA helicase PcrA